MPRPGTQNRSGLKGELDLTDYWVLKGRDPLAPVCYLRFLKKVGTSRSSLLIKGWEDADFASPA